MKLRNFLLHQLYEVERMNDYEVATETVRAWIDLHEESQKEKGLDLKKMEEKLEAVLAKETDDSLTR